MLSLTFGKSRIWCHFICKKEEPHYYLSWVTGFPSGNHLSLLGFHFFQESIWYFFRRHPASTVHGARSSGQMRAFWSFSQPRCAYINEVSLVSTVLLPSLTFISPHQLCWKKGGGWGRNASQVKLTHSPYNHRLCKSCSLTFCLLTSHLWQQIVNLNICNIRICWVPATFRYLNMTKRTELPNLSSC